MENHFSSEEIWADFYANSPVITPWQAALERYGITPEVELRMASRGFVIVSVDEESLTPRGQTMPGTPAHKAMELIYSDNELTDEMRLEQFQRFLRDVIHEDDEDRFRTQWPELF